AVFKKTSNNILWLIIKPAGTERWQLPKGRIEKGETSKETATREVAEETGVKTKILEKIGTQEYFYQMEERKIKKNVVFYLMAYDGNTGKKPDTKEIAETQFVSFNKALEMLTFENDKETLQNALKKLKQEIGLV